MNCDECPKCDRCGAPVTTGLMAVFCPRAEQCEFWPDHPESVAFVRELRQQDQP
jgi:hypothetical protein